MYFAKNFIDVVSLNLHSTPMKKMLELYSFNKDIRSLSWQELAQGFEGQADTKASALKQRSSTSRCDCPTLLVIRETQMKTP